MSAQEALVQERVHGGAPVRGADTPPPGQQVSEPCILLKGSIL